MKNSSLQLEDFFIGDLSLNPTKGPFTGSGQIKVDVKLDYKRNESDKQSWMVELHISFKAGQPEPISYEGHIEIIGYFTVGDATMPEDKQADIVAVNGPSILYSSARELIAMLTGHGRNGRLILPSVSFIDHRISLPPSKESSTTKSEESGKLINTARARSRT